jgi:hypothetical protein
MLLAATFRGGDGAGDSRPAARRIELIEVVRGSGPVWHRASPSSNTKWQLAKRTIDAAPPEQSKRKNT